MNQEQHDDVTMSSGQGDERWETHYTQNHQPMENVVQMMVPQMSCVEQENNSMVHGSSSTSQELGGTSILRNGSCDTEKLENNELPDSLPMTSPFINPEHPDSTFFNEIFHYLCTQTFPRDASESHKKIIKKRSASYSIDKDGILVYGTKHTKRIITDPEEQKKIMADTHIEEGTGVHIGVRKMHQLISNSVFWRSMYLDIGTTVRGCTECTEAVPLGTKKTHENLADVNRENSRRHIWEKVELKLIGPFSTTANGNQYVMRLVDPESRFLVAEASNRDNLEKDCAKFIFKTMCKFGIVDCTVTGMGRPEFEAAQVFYKNKIQMANEIMEASSVLVYSEESDDIFDDEIIERFCADNPANWDQKLEIFVHQYCLKSDEGKSPFSVMFSRSLSENKETKASGSEPDCKASLVPSRRRLRSSTLQCRHCCEIFTSKISFRIHQRKHTEEARKRGTVEGEQKLFPLLKQKKHVFKTKRKRKLIGRGERLLTIPNGDWSQNGTPSPGVRTQMAQSAVEAVKNLLQATKEERTKRGKYFKYTQELRDQIAKYAMDHSVPAAAMYWSDRLGSTVSESSIRNFIKAYKSFSLTTKEEIGRYAFHNGLERAVVDYSQKLGCELRKGVVIKFKKLYMEKVCDSNASLSSSDSKTPVSRAKRAYSFQMKDEIGRYAAQHGIPAAMDHFSIKLQFSVKESTVRKFKRRFQDKHSTNNEFGAQTPPVATSQQTTNQNMEVLHPQLSLLGTPHPASSAGPVSSSNNFVYQHPYSINMGQPSGIHSNAIIPMNSNLTFHQGGLINQSVTSLSYQQSPTPQTVIMNQPFNPVATPTFQQGYVNNFNPGMQNIPGVQSAPIAVAHTSLSSSLSHVNPSIQLTMGPPPIAQLNHVGLSPNHHVGSHNMQSAASSNHPNQVSQQVASVACFHQSVPSGVSFDNSQHVNSNLSLNEPLSLMKEPNHEPMEMQSNVVLRDTMPTSSHGSGLHVSSNDVPPMEGQPSQEISSVHTEEEMSLEPEDLSEPPTPTKRRRTKKGSYSKSSYTCGKRGNYGCYSPELRAEIGRYAMQHGNLEALAFFKQKLSMNIPESTVRGLKEKYVAKRMREEREVKSLGFGPRGRPMRLGEYDVVVQDCIKELVKQGEKVSSFLVIATAKQVLMDNEPSLLEENGGPVTLNPTWAKSFLKRIGLNQLS